MDAVLLAFRSVDVRRVTAPLDARFAALGLRAPRGLFRLFSEESRDLRDQCIAKAHELDMGIVAMKVLGAGMLSGAGRRQLEGLPGAACRYVLQDERVQNVTIGMRFPTEIDSNVKTLSGDTSFTNEDRALLADASTAVLTSGAASRMTVE